MPDAARSRPRRKVLAAVLVALVAAGLLGGAAYAWAASRQSNPDKVFQAALSHALTTRTYSQQVTSGKDRLTLLADVSDVKKGAVSIQADVQSVQLKFDMYATGDDMYTKFSGLGGLFGDSGASAADRQIESRLENKWIHTGKQDDAAGDGSPMAGLGAGAYGPASAVLGEYITGNFAPADRQALLDIIAGSHVYSYDPKRVTDAQADGQDVLRYQVTIHAAALKKLNQKAAAMIGADPAKLDSLGLSLPEKDLPATIYVATGDQRLVKVEATLDSQPTTIAYSGYDTTKLPARPKADLESKDLGAYLFQGLSDPALTAPVPAAKASSGASAI